MMNISELSIAQNSVNSGALKQLNLTVGDTGNTRGPTYTVGQNIPAGMSQSAVASIPLQNIDVFQRCGFQEDYSVRDAAASLFKKQDSFNLNDPESMKRSVEWTRSRLAKGIRSLEPTTEELDEYLEKLRAGGMKGEVAWSDGNLGQELKAFLETSAGELADGVDYLASRYVALMDKLERGYSGEELEAQKARFGQIYQEGADGFVDGYVRLLQDHLGISGADAEDVWESLRTALDQRISDYQGVMDQVRESVENMGADGVWLKDCDAFIAAQLRKEIPGSAAKAAYSVQDLASAGKIAEAYRDEFGKVRYATVTGKAANEGTIAMDLAMVDIKTETMIAKGLVSGRMADLLHRSQTARQQGALDAADRYLAGREANRGKYAAVGSYAPLDRAMFQSIYDVMMNAYRQSGDVSAAIRAGASEGKLRTEAANRARPEVVRWLNTAYWENFYEKPAQGTKNALQIQISNLLQQAGLRDKSVESSYQNYVNDWQDFLASIGESGGGMSVRA